MAMSAKKRGTVHVMLFAIALLSSFFMHLPAADAQPSPHNVEGRVFHSDGVTGVENGIPVLINNTNATNTFVYTQVSAPPAPQFRGSYSATINGSDNDTIEAWAWNATYYGYNRTNLSATTTRLNIVLTTLRPSEPNVTILVPQNNTLINISRVLYFNATIGIMGGQDGTNCNATISFSNEQVVNITQDQNFTNQLGNMVLGTSKTTRWNVSALSTGYTNVTVLAQCSSDGINFAKLHVQTSYNITVQDIIAPNITLLSPLNNTLLTADITNYTDAYFYYTVLDGSPIKNCTLVLNNRLNVSNTSVARGVQQFLRERLVVGDYNWSVNCTDNSTLPLTNTGGTFYYNVSIIPNLPPVVQSILLTTPFDLAPASTTFFSCNGTVYEPNNISDIVRVNATLFQDSIGGNGPDDNNDHYTNASCHSVSNSTYYANYTCGFSLQYYANNGTWQCNITATDSAPNIGFENRTFAINELLAVEVSPNVIDYGKLQATNISPDDVNMTVTNRGNVPFNVTVEGYGEIPLDGLAMRCDTGTVPIGNQRYSVNHSLLFGTMVPLTGTATEIKNLTLAQRTNDAALGLSSNMTYWKLQLPTLVQGNCNGTVVFRTFLG
jgi:hypothetical protein